MKIKILSGLVFLVFVVSAKAQTLRKVYSQVTDSMDYVQSLEYIGGKIFFEKGRHLPLPLPYCGNSGPQYILDNNIYEVKKDTVVPFILSHLDKKDPASLEVIDSANLLSGYEYFDFTDTTGVFLPIRLSSHYWTNKSGKIHLIALGKDTLISSYYPRWFKDKLLVYVRDNKPSEHLYYFNRKDLKLDCFLNGPYNFRPNNPVIYDSLLVFNTYDPDIKDSRLYYSDYEGNFRRLSFFTRGQFHVNQEIQIDSFLFLRVQDKGMPDNYKNEFFKATAFWKLNLHTKEMKEIKVMPEYGITSGRRNLNGNFVTMFGYRQYQVFKMDNTGLTTQLQNHGNKIKHFTPLHGQTDSSLFMIGVDQEADSRLVVLSDFDQPIKYSEKIKEVKYRKVIGNSILVLYVDKEGGNKLGFFDKEKGLQSIEITDNLEETTFVDVFYFKGQAYLFVADDKHSDLYQLDRENLKTKLVLPNILNQWNHGLKRLNRRKINYRVTDQGVYFIVDEKAAWKEFSIYLLE